MYISLSPNVNILLNQSSVVQQTVRRFFEGVRNFLIKWRQTVKLS